MNRRTARPKKRSNFKARIHLLWNRIIHCNPPAAICSHLVGKHHSRMHRLLVGCAIMGIGVIIAQNGGAWVSHALPHNIAHIAHYLFDGIGYLGHGIGAMPFLESLERYRTGD